MWNLSRLSSLLVTESLAFQQALQFGLIGRIKNCPNCNSPCLFTSRNITSNFGRCFYCRHCAKRFSALNKTIFYKTRLPIGKVILLLYCWATKFTQDQASIECSTSVQTVCSFYTQFRQYCQYHVIQQRIGGQGFTVECDETLYAHQKSYVGHVPISQVWVVGGFVGKLKKFFLKKCQIEPELPLSPYSDSA